MKKTILHSQLEITFTEKELAQPSEK